MEPDALTDVLAQRGNSTGAMDLTEYQRQQLGDSPEWLELQLQKMNLYIYLVNTRFEDLHFDGLHKALEQVSLRVAAFYDTSHYKPGGHDGTLDPGAVCMAGRTHDDYSGRDANASSEYARHQAPGAAGPNIQGGRFYAC